MVTGARPVCPRPHQQQALDALAARLGAGRSRAQLVMACGSGKTLVGRWFAAQGAVTAALVVVPSLALVAQTLKEWRSDSSWTFRAVVTCSDPGTAAGDAERGDEDGSSVDGPFWDRQRAVVTTQPGPVESRLRRATSSQPLVVFSTYHSVTVAAAAARAAGVEYDLVVADEAHNLAGNPRQDFRVVLSEKELPARNRVFMTATPLTGAAAAADRAIGRDRSIDAPISMDDESLFGPVVFRLDVAEAIGRQLLTDYRVMVFETAGEVSPDPLSALVGASSEGLSSVLTFHGRVAKARAFAAAVDGLSLPDGRTVRARAVAGSDSAGQREQALRLLASPTPEHLTVVSSARCLTEGVDIPAVDGVMFADPKSSQIDVVQAVGRALRPSPGKSSGTVLLPVCIPAGLDVDTALSTGSFAWVWRVLRALRTVDSRLDLELRSPRLAADLGREVRRRVEFRIPSFNAVEAVEARVVDFTSDAWERKFAELADFAAAQGHARPPASSPLGVLTGDVGQS